MNAGSRLQWKLSLSFLLLLLLGLWVSGLAERGQNEIFHWVFLSSSILALWAIFHWGVLRVVIQPFNEILEVIRKYTEGLFNWRVRLGTRKDDMGELGRQLNDMGEAIGGKIDRLSQALAETEALLGGMEEGC